MKVPTTANRLSVPKLRKNSRFCNEPNLAGCQDTPQPPASARSAFVAAVKTPHKFPLLQSSYFLGFVLTAAHNQHGNHQCETGTDGALCKGFIHVQFKTTCVQVRAFSVKPAAKTMGGSRP